MVTREINQVITFATLRERDVRTIGTILRLPRGDDLRAWGPSDAQAFSRYFEPRSAQGASARGKVVFLGERIATIYQVYKRNASPVVCGNASAAAAAALSQSNGKNSFDFVIEAPYCPIAVNTDVVLSSPLLETYVVDQRWTLPIMSVVPLEVAGRRAVSLSLLNEYLIVEGSTDTSDTLLANTKYRDWLQVPGHKIAFVTFGNAECDVKFFGCNGLHGAAPLSGMLNLAMAASTTPWLEPLLEIGFVRHPRGMERLPKLIHQTASDATVELPRLDVHLCSI